MKFKNILLTACMTVGLASAASANIIVIDDFSTDQGPITITAIPGSDVASGWVGVNGAGILGGQRDVQIYLAPESSRTNNASIEFYGSEMHFASAPGTSGYFDIRWDGTNTLDAIDVNGLGGIDFTTLGEAAFTTPIMFSDLNAWFDVTFWSDNGSIVESKKLYIPGHDGFATNTARQSFFTSAEFTETNFANIGAIQVRGNVLIPHYADTDYVYDPRAMDGNGEITFAGTRIDAYDLTVTDTFATSVPEPASAALFGLGAFGLLAMRKKKAV